MNRKDDPTEVTPFGSTPQAYRPVDNAAPTEINHPAVDKPKPMTPPQAHPGAQPAHQPQAPQHTTLVGFDKPQPALQPSPEGVSAPQQQAQSAAAIRRGDDPVVGWLVIVDGPGRGASVEIGAGRNEIGRSADPKDRNRIVLNYGDTAISGVEAGAIAFEPRGRAFMLIPGRSSNLVYLNGAAIYSPSPMQSGDMIQIGVTTLRFVALCGEDFSWDAPVKA
jgi:hypothetical protein